MADRFTGYGMPNIDFSPLARLPEVYQQARQEADTQGMLAEIAANGGKIDDKTALRMMRANPQLGLSLARLAETQAQHEFSRSQAGVTQKNWQADYDEKVRQFNAGRTPVPTLGEINDPVTGQPQKAVINPGTGEYKPIGGVKSDKPEVVWQEGPSGEKEPYLVSPDRKTIKRLPIEGETGQPSNPFAQGGKVNEAQSKDGLYASRMLASEKILRDPAVLAAATKSSNLARQATSEKAPFGIARPIVPEDFQKFDQARRDFINATLRRESGAVINPDEFKNAERQYFPQPGDTTGVLAQKRANRAEAIKGIAVGAGKGYKFTHRFNEQGEIVPNDSQTGALTRVETGPQMKAGAHPVPPAFANDPEGTEYRKGGKVWVRHGNQLVPQ